jgi:hypothetical protein
VVSNIPYNNSIDVSVFSIITIIFNENINITSINSSIIIYPAISYNLDWYKNNTILEIVFTERLDYYSAYILFIDTTATDISGNSFLEPYILKFTTIDTTDKNKLESGNVDEGEERPKNYTFLIITIIIWIFIILILLIVLKGRRRRAIKSKLSYPKKIKNWLLGSEEETEIIEELAALSKRLAEDTINEAEEQGNLKKIKMAKKYLHEANTFRKSALKGNEEYFKKAINKYNDAIDVIKKPKLLDKVNE